MEHSREYTSFQQDWIKDADWPEARDVLLKDYPHLADGEKFAIRIRQTLDDQMRTVNQ